MFAIKNPVGITVLAEAIYLTPTRARSPGNQKKCEPKAHKKKLIK
jgi:hypothetical protein